VFVDARARYNVLDTEVSRAGQRRPNAKNTVSREFGKTIVFLNRVLIG
jgi:hypothetical protein